MFIRSKHRGERTYLQLVENQRVDGKVRQRVLSASGQNHPPLSTSKAATR